MNEAGPVVDKTGPGFKPIENGPTFLRSGRHKLRRRVAASRPKVLAMADGQTIAELRLPLKV